MNIQDHYKILGVKRNASLAAIKLAFRRLALKHHPDRNVDDPYALDRFHKIQKAYETLSNKSKRKEYDLYRDSKLARHLLIKTLKDKKKVTVSVNKRVAFTDDQIIVTMNYYETGSHFRLQGLHHFHIIEGPFVESFPPETDGPLLEIKYVLQPKSSGYVLVGPASFIHSGVKYLSEPVHLKVNLPPEQIKLRPPTRFEKVQSSLVSGLILFYVVLIAYNIYKYDILPGMNPPVAVSIPETESPILGESSEIHLNTGFAPYKKFYGAGVFDSTSFNKIRYKNGRFVDAVVCLTDAESDRTIRNNYIQAGQTFTMSGIPDGIYYLKVLFGNDWNKDKLLMNEKVQGGFNKNVRYELFHQEINLLNFQQSRSGDTLNYKIYDITLYPVSGGNVKSIIADEEVFF